MSSGVIATQRNKMEAPSARLRRGDITFEDFVDLIPDGQKADLLDGVIYMASPDNLRANDLNTWLCTVLGGYVGARELGIVYVSRVAYRLGLKHGPEPDLSFVAKDAKVESMTGFVKGPPTLAVEIVSPDSVHRDYVLKRRIYEEAGVKEYWILDPDEKRATFLCLNKHKFERRKPVKNIWCSEAVPGFWLDVRWLTSERRPREYAVLRQLLEA